MSKRPWMPYFYMDFAQDTRGFTAEEKGIYHELIDLAWHRGDGSIPADMNWLKNYLQQACLGFHGHRFNQIVPKLLAHFFSLEGEKYYQKRVRSELEIAEKRSANGRQNVEKRWLGVRNINNLSDATLIRHGNANHNHIKNSSFLTVSETTPREEEKRVAEEASKKVEVISGTSELAAIIRRKGWV